MTFAFSSAQSGALMRVAINAMPYLVLLAFQLVHGMGPAEAGGMLMVYMAGNIAMKPATTWILRHGGFRDVLAWNGALSATASAALAFVDRDTSTWIVTLILFVAGLSRSLNFTATNTLAFADIAPAARNDASTLVSVLQQAALSLGVGVAAGLLAISEFGPPRPEADDFRFAFLIVSLLMAISAFGYLVSPPRNAGDNLRA